VWTLGVNWYWRSNFRTSLNYAIADSSKYSRSAGGIVDDKPSSVQARLQFFW
jgi:phosphate-selective porin OprO and OprP